jgi:hypothetical protein
VKYINCLGNERTNGARRTSEIKFRIAMAKEALKKDTFTENWTYIYGRNQQSATFEAYLFWCCNLDILENR